MTVLAWIAPDTWQRCVAAVAARTEPGEEVLLVHVIDEEAVAAAGGARAGLLGRGRDRSADRWTAIAADDAQALLDDAAAVLDRPTRTQLRRGRVEHVITEMSADHDLLVLVRDGERRPGPHSLGRAGRFVVDHATCPVLVVAP